MKTTGFRDFISASTSRTQMKDIHKNLYHNIQKYDEAVVNGKKQFVNLEQAKQKAYELKKNAIDNLYSNLLLFEKKSIANGSQVLWAENSEDALNYIKQIATAKQAKSVVKSKSMVTEEIHLNAFLEKNGIEAIETDLGEFIQQLDGEPPIHILTPAMHKNKEDVANLFHKKLGVEPGLSPYELTKIARQILRKKFIQAEIGISGANFILPDIGGIALTENEGNARLTVGYPKTHIVIVGIEKVIPSVIDLALFWPLLATHGTGQKVTSYNTIITGPKTLLENSGPDEMYIILLDNGRTKILADKVQRESLFCIRCGACLNACPIYKNMAGGHGYHTTYSGPIGSVITPHLKEFKNMAHLSFASTLCGACTEVCPVKIPLHNLLLNNRKKAQEKNLSTLQEKIQWKIWTWLVTKSWILPLFNHRIKTLGTQIFAKGWNKNRAKIVFAPRSFFKLYKKKNKQ